MPANYAQSQKTTNLVQKNSPKKTAFVIKRRAVIRSNRPSNPDEPPEPFNPWALVRQICYWASGVFLIIEPYRHLTKITEVFADDALFRKDNQHPVLVQVVAWLVLFPVGLAFWIIDISLSLAGFIWMLGVFLSWHIMRLMMVRLLPAAFLAANLVGIWWFHPVQYATFDAWKTEILAIHPADTPQKMDILLHKYAP